MLAPGEESINGIFTLKGLFKLNGLKIAKKVIGKLRDFFEENKPREPGTK